MVEAAQGEVWWAELPQPAGSGPWHETTCRGGSGEFAEPEPDLDRGGASPLTSNLAWADAPGNTVAAGNGHRFAEGLRRQRVAGGRARSAHWLAERVRRIGDRQLALILRGIDVVLGR